MRCDTCRELFDDLERKRLAASLEAEATDHVAGCPACREALAAHRAVVHALESVPAPVLPDGFEAELERRLRQADRTAPDHGWLGRLFGLRPVFGYALSAAAAAAFTAAIVHGISPSDNRYESSPAFRPAEGLYSVVVPPAPPAARVCQSSDTTGALRVGVGEDVDVTLSVQTPELMEGAKVYMVLPQGLEFSPATHPDLTDRHVATFQEDIQEGKSDFGFSVRGAKAGRWEVTALVEDGDSFLVGGTTIIVAQSEEQL